MDRVAIKQVWSGMDLVSLRASLRNLSNSTLREVLLSA
jgi:hypothetical protein